MGARPALSAQLGPVARAASRDGRPGCGAGPDLHRKGAAGWLQDQGEAGSRSAHPTQFRRENASSSSLRGGATHVGADERGNKRDAEVSRAALSPVKPHRVRKAEASLGGRGGVKPRSHCPQNGLASRRNAGARELGERPFPAHLPTRDRENVQWGSRCRSLGGPSDARPSDVY